MIALLDPLATGRTLARALAGSWREEPPPLALDPEGLASVAALLIEAGAAGLVWRRVRRTPLAAAPLALDMRDAARLETARTLQGEEALSQATATLAAVGIEPLLAKGWAVGGLYPMRALRPYCDLDLYVPPPQILAARAALRPLSLPIGLDLQPHPVELDDREHAELVAHAVAHPLGGLTVRVLGPEDHLRLLCLHLLRHEGIRPLWLCDVAAALESLPPHADWRYLLRGSRRRARWILCVLALARALLGATGGPPALPRLGAPRWVEDALLRRWARGMRIFPRRTVLASLREPRVLGEALRDRWPNPLAAAVHWGGAPDARPRARYQILDILWLAAWFAHLHLRPLDPDRRAQLSDARFERMRRLTI